MLCLTLPVESEKSALELFARYRSLTALVEVRLDYCRGIRVAELVKMGAKVIATCRRVQDGGKFIGSENQRLQILSQAYRDGASFVDIEIDAAQNLSDVPDSARLLSFHNFSNEIIPWDDLLKRFPKNSGVIKIVQTANSANDNLELFRFLKKRPAPNIIAHLMGKYGRLSRLLSHRFNCPWTYVVPEEFQSEIQGVLSTREAEMIRFADINADTKIFGILGDPVEHSRSGEIYNAYFKRANLNAVFLPIAVADVESFLRDCAIISPVGFAVTMPHKERVLSICSELDDSAKKAGASNTLLKTPSGWKGFNTDYLAVKSFFAEEYGAGESAIVFGAGGAARSAAYALKELNYTVYISNRNSERAGKLVRDLSLQSVVENDWNKLNPRVIVNATSVGMIPQENECPLDVSLLTGKELVLDFVHTPDDTVLIKAARRAECRVITGVRFFNRQADFQQRILLGGIKK